MKRFLLASLVATTLGCGPLEPIPAAARATDEQAAAWSMSNVFCAARTSGVPLEMALRAAYRSTKELWGARIDTAGFPDLAAMAILARCPALTRPSTSI